MVVNEELETRIHEIFDNGEYRHGRFISYAEPNDIINLLKSIPSREDKVKEFYQTFNQVVNDKPTKLTEDTIRLRLNLIQEELDELADSLDFAKFNDKYQTKSNITFEIDQDLTKAFDAVLDLQYVLSGTIVSLGMANIFEEGFDEVHRSNMSKSFNKFEDAEGESAGLFMTKGIKTRIESSPNGKYILQRIEDNKTIKPSTYSPANLQPILDKV
ncbi:MAG: nucleoside triphosphate pyrophosphohydrolase family protein [Bdellovibrionales bacterium]|nr:nucleoside triphosphate pyrophosphohydrolase family protein [Bdellovibrionales bacterium]